MNTVINETRALLDGLKNTSTSAISNQTQPSPCLPYWILNAINIQYV